MTSLPGARGPITECLFDRFVRPPAPLPDLTAHLGDPLGEDAQLALFLLQELAYRPLEGVDDAWEHEPSAMALRVRLEGRFEELVRSAVSVPRVEASEVRDAVVDLVANFEGPSLSSWVLANATIDHVRELAVHRSPYQLKEADPHTFGLPRLPAGAAKSALLEIQADEYGCEPSEAHAVLFADTMVALDLEPRVDLELVPAPTLATNTLLGLLASSRRLLAGLLGHLAVFEMTSVEPMSRYAATMRRLLPGPAGTRAARFYDVHVAADARHEVLALDRMVVPYAAEEPDRVGDLLFGAAAVMLVERCFAEHVLERWLTGRSSLRAPLPDSSLAGAGHPMPLAG